MIKVYTDGRVLDNGDDYAGGYATKVINRLPDLENRGEDEKRVIYIALAISVVDAINITLASEGTINSDKVLATIGVLAYNAANYIMEHMKFNTAYFCTMVDRVAHTKVNQVLGNTSMLTSLNNGILREIDYLSKEEEALVKANHTTLINNYIKF